MPDILVLGAGTAACGATHHLAAHGIRPVVLEQRAHVGGHAATFVTPEGFVFDDGPHISFTSDARIRDRFAANVDHRYVTFRAEVNNHWRGHWIKHPAQCNLHGLPTDLLVPLLTELIAAQHAPAGSATDYEAWLVSTYGRTFAETFPMAYGRKYHTAPAVRMTTDWLGPRMYRPRLEEVLRGVLEPTTDDVHYVSEFRYPEDGGFVAYLAPFLRNADVHLGQRVIGVAPRERVVTTADGRRWPYDGLVSSLPLPVLVPMIDESPTDVREAAGLLACTQCVVVSIGVARPDLSVAHWSYIYDDDICFTRVSYPHMFSPGNAPPGTGSIQVELYFSDKYRPLTVSPDACIAPVLADLKRIAILRDDDVVLSVQAWLSPYANVIFDHDRPAAVATVRSYLADVGITTCGRYGEWGYHWTDESFISGETAAEVALAGHVGTATS